MFYMIEVGRESFRAETASDVHMIGEVLFDLEQYLKNYPLPLPTEEIKLAFSEGMSNAIVHGNRGNPFLHVTVQLTARADSVRIVFENGGTGFDWRSLLPAPKPAGEAGQGEVAGQTVSDAVAVPVKEGGLRRLQRLGYRLEFNDPGTILALHKPLPPKIGSV